MRALFLALLSLFPFTVYAAGDGVLARPVNQTWLGDNELTILPLLGLGTEVQGRRIIQLTLKAYSDTGNGQAAAHVGDDDVTDFQTINSAPRTYTFLIPEAQQTVQHVEDFQIHLRGHIVVQEVGVKMLAAGTQPSPPPPPPVTPPPVTPPPSPAPAPHPQPAPPPSTPEHVTIWLRQYFQNANSLWLSRYADFRAFAGARLGTITVTGASHFGNATLALCLAGGQRCSGGVVPASRSSLQWQVHESVNRGVEGWRLDLKGEMYIERIDLDFE